VICPAEELPFADASFDVTACRTAAHHFDDLRAAVREMARASRERVPIADTLDMGPEAEQAEALRDPTHVRNYTEAEWSEVVKDAGLAIDELRVTAHTIDFPAGSGGRVVVQARRPCGWRRCGTPACWTDG
jgi:SAM-dependent methyltransferase